MKNLIVITIMLATSLSASATSHRPRSRSINHNCIHVIAMDNEIFYFKSDRDVDGAAISVYDFQTGKEVIADTITKKKTIIDMYLQKPADYIIIITKGDFSRRYVFEKR